MKQMIGLTDTRRRTAGRRSWLATGGAILAALVLAAMPVEAAGTTPLNTNLVKNPGAQSGAPGAAIPNWEPFGNFVVITYAAPGAPTPSEGNRIGGGTKLFTTGPFNVVFDECDSADQFFTVKGRGGAIDSGHVKVTLKARMGTVDGAEAIARVNLYFRDANNEQLTTPHSGQLTLGPVATNGTLSLKKASKKVPRKARIFRLQMDAGDVTTSCDALFDNLSVVLTSI